MNTQTVLKRNNARGYSLRGFKSAPRTIYFDFEELKKRSSRETDDEALMNMVYREMAEFKETICDAIAGIENASLEQIIHRVFFKTVDYFNSLEKLALTRQIFLASVSPSANETTLAVSSVVRDTNCAIFSAIYSAYVNNDFDSAKCQFIVARYMTMLQSFLNWMFPKIGEYELIERTAETVWNTFEGSIAEV